MAIKFTERHFAQADVNYDEYKKLRNKMENVDNKYSLSYHEPQLDMPESLNLEKMTYEMPDEDELLKNAEQRTEADYITDKYKIEKAETAGRDKLDGERTQAERAEEELMKKLADKLQSDTRTVSDDTLKKGTARSSIRSEGLSEARSVHDSGVSQAQASKEEKLADIQRRLQQLAEQTASALSSLDQTRDAEIKETLEKLLAEAERQRDSVMKYNNTVEEKEQKYQAQREKAYESARQAENQRAMKAASLYAQLGASGVEEQKLNEKLSLAKQFFGTMSRAEAKSLLNSDSFMYAQLGKYYNYLTDFVNSLPE